MMSEQEQITLVGVIGRIKEIAVQKYEGKAYDNILTIFNQLNVKERRTLLKGFINICFILEDKSFLNTNITSDVKEIKDVVKGNREKITTELANIDSYNKIELIKLKTWIIKMFSIILVGGFISIIIFIIFFGNSSEKVSGSLSNIVNTIKLVLGL